MEVLQHCILNFNNPIPVPLGEASNPEVDLEGHPFEDQGWDGAAAGTGEGVGAVQPIDGTGHYWCWNL